MSDAHPIERFWSLLLTGNGESVAALLEPNASWDDPLHDGAKGDNVRSAAIPRLAAWAQAKTIEKSVKHLRTIADPKRVVIEGRGLRARCRRRCGSIIDLFKPDGYFREPANNFACGRDQLLGHFKHILELGGVGMPEPQAGFAAYELGPNGLLQGSRAYDSVVPPSFT